MRVKSLLILLVMAVVACGVELTLDGKLDEAVWQKAEKHSGFVKAKQKQGSPEVKAQTEFSVIQEADAVYFGIKCYEPMMDKLIKKEKTAAVWTDDGLEIFLAPSGLPSDFYQFRLTINKQNATLFYGEGGAIQPDPYSPDWTYEVHLDKDFWSCEVVFPLTAFYMTRQNLWRSEWLVDVSRTRTPEKESSSWSQRIYKFLEPKQFRKMGGFPMRKENDDVWVSDARAIVSGKRDNGTLTGVLALTVNVPKRSEYTVNGKRMELKAGANKVSVPHEYAKSGRNVVSIVCKRKSDGKEFKRKYPVVATYEPLKVRLTQPEYRNNFYPGQDSSVIAGRIERIGNGKVTLTLTGDGLKTQTKVLDKSLEFSFDGKGFKEGATAELKAETQGITQVVKIQKLAPSKHKMSWISNGMLVIDGKPIMPRRMSAVYYHGGEAFKKKYDSDNLHITRDITSQVGAIEPFRLIKGIEQKEATRDVRPCDELFKKIDETIEKNKDKDFVSYEISDEPECRHISPEYLGYIYRYLMEKDPYHVVHMCSRSASNYIDCADWFEPHPYINPVIFNGERRYGREINTIGSFLDEISLQNRPDKCVGLNATAFSYKYNSDASDYPNFREMICHIWAGMNHGAKTLKSYAYHDLGDRPSIYEGIAAPSDFDIHANLDPQNAGVYYSTFYHSAADFTLPIGVEAYTAVISGDALNLTKVAVAGQTIPSDNAVILKSTVQDYTLTASAATAGSVGANSLQGTDAAIANPNYGKVYVLSAENGSVGFYKLADGASIPAHKAFVTITGSMSAPKRLRFVFNEENTATDIDQMENGKCENAKMIRDGQLIIIRNGVEYNANGQIVK